MQKPALLLATLLLLLGLVVIRESHQQPLSEVESRFVDWLSFTAEPSVSPATQLTLVEISDTSLQPPHTWPWAPLDYALFLQASLNFSPSVVAISEILDWQQTAIPPDQQFQYAQHQKSLHDLLLKTPKALLGAQFGALKDPDVVPPQQAIPLVQNIKGDRQRIPEYSVIEAQPQELYRLSPTLGFTNLPEGSAVRRVPLLFRYRGEIAPSFVLQSLMLWFQLTPEDVQIELGKHIRLGHERSIPIDDSGAMLVNFGSQFQRISYEDLLLAASRNQTAVQPGSLILLSRTDSDSRFLSSADGTPISAGELFAAAISTARNGQFLHTASLTVELAMIAACICFGSFILRYKTSAVWLLVLAAFSAYLFAALSMFYNTMIALPLLLPLSLLLFTAVFRSCLQPASTTSSEASASI